MDAAEAKSERLYRNVLRMCALCTAISFLHFALDQLSPNRDAQIKAMMLTIDLQQRLINGDEARIKNLESGKDSLKHLVDQAINSSFAKKGVR